MADQLKNLMIGLFVTAAAAIIIFILMYIHPRVGDEGKLIHVHFTDIDKITLGTRVTYAGKPVGEVVGIDEIEMGRGGPTDPNGRVYLYDLTLRVDSGVDIYNTDKISARTSGLLGEKNVEITPYAAEDGEDLLRIDNQPVLAIQTESIEDTLKGINLVASKFARTLDAITDTVNHIQDQQIVEKISNSLSNIESITASLNRPQDWSGTLTNIHQLSQKLINSWNDIEKTFHDIDIAAVKFSETADSATGVVNQIAEGKGTLGKLLGNDDLYLRTNSIMSKVETTLDDINHYGLLFHSDKGWQRLRARRLNLLQKLRTPQEFRNYFNDEIDQISTSISRVYMVLNGVNEDPYCGNLMQCPEYSKVFAELMRRVAMLEEEIRMYNTQVVETQVHQTELGCPPCCQ